MWTTLFVTLMIKLVSQLQPERGVKNSTDPLSFTKKSCVQEKREIVPRISSESHQCCSTCQLACCHQIMLLGRAVRQKKLKGWEGRANCVVIHLESQLPPGHRPRENMAGHFCYSLAAPSLLWTWPSPRQLDSAGHVGSGTEVRDS